MKRMILLILLSGLILSGCTTTNSFFYSYEKGDCLSNRFEDIDNDLDLSFQWKNDSLYLRWDQYQGDDFQGYYLLREGSDTCPFYYRGGDYHKYISKRVTTLYADDVIGGENYYYRLCVLQGDKNVDCGAVFKVEVY